MEGSDDKTDQTKLNVLIGAGKEMAVGMLRDAQMTAKTPDQLSAQVFATQICGCHILAHCAFNQEKQAGMNGEEWLDLILKQIKIDLNNLREADKRGEMKFEPIIKKPEIVKG